MTELYDILPKDLQETFDSLDYEEDGGLTIRAVKYLDKDLYFDFAIYLGNIEQNETQLWQLHVENCHDSNIDMENMCRYFSFYSDHFLLWKFIDNEMELYFKKETNNPEMLLADIYTVHNTIFNGYISLEKYLNGSNLLTLCKSNNGLFARGPERILKYYFDCLHKAGKEPYFYGNYIHKKWDGEKWVSENGNFKVAIIGGTYFVGQNFNFRRLDK